MSVRNRADQGLNNEWDLLKEEYNNTSYDPPYVDSNLNAGSQLDHCRLYIRNIPMGLNEEGLRTAFSKYGTLNEVHLSKDPQKRYALVRFDTAGEARLAMTKLNNTDPMRFSISIANKPKKKQESSLRDNREYEDRNIGTTSAKRSIRDDNSVSSRDKSFRQFEDMCEPIDESLAILNDDLDPDTKMKGLQLELQRLQVQEQTVLLRQQLLQLEAARKKNFNPNVSTNRCILPDGRIVVQNVKDRMRREKIVTWNLESNDLDGSFAAGAGDSLTLPALQREPSHSCVTCGSAADAYCAQCGVTPYCSKQCQRKDWLERHRSVCHNLARLFKKSEPQASDTDINKIPSMAPLRRPHSPSKQTRREDVNDKAQRHSSPAINNNYNKSAGRNMNNNNNRKFTKPCNNRNSQPKQESREEDEEDWGSKKVTSHTQPAAKPVTVNQEPVKPLPRVEETIKAADPAPKVVNNVKPPAKLDEVTPARKLVPKNYLIELLPIGEQVLLSVDAVAADCRSKKPGYICLSMHEKFQTEFQALCETYVVACEEDKDEYTAKPGESFSYLNPEDGGWYRARCLAPALAALLDSGRLVPLRQATLRRLAGQYETYPEFCCLLTADNVKVGDNLMATIKSKTSDGFLVSLENIETGLSVGDGEISRWLPTVDYPVLASPSVQPQIPEVPRPDLVNNSKMLLVEATALDNVYVRPADTESQRKYDTLLQDVVLYGRNASPCKEPPAKGQVVIAKFTDGLHYRALCKRTSVKQNKYMLEYVDFGNTEIAQLENLYPCPPNLDLSAVPTEASQAVLQCTWAGALSEPAIQYIQMLKDDPVELVLTLPSGAKSENSGSTICLAVAKNNESVNRKLQELCTPEWKKIEENGGDVVDLECLHYKALEYPELPATGCELDISDISNIESGVLSGCPRGLPHVDHVLNTLTQRMADYCNSELGKEAYLPKNEELCIAPFPPYPQWFRAVLIEHFTGCPTARVCYVDYGNVEEIPVNTIRKMLPEFVRGEPALAIHLEIRDFPKSATAEMLSRAIKHMQVSDDGRGTLKVTRCEKIEHGMYVVDAPEFIKAVLAK